MSDISIAFLILVAANLTIKFWLNRRQAAQVKQHAAQVPARFAAVITLEAHQKAAAYTRAKIRLSQISLVIDTAWLLLLTLGGGINLIYGVATALAGNESTLITGLVFLISLGILSGIVDLPVSIYRQFGLEARFGFNRMTPALFIIDLLRNALVSLIIALPLLALILWLLDLATPMSWLWAWLGWMVFNALLLFIYPVVIAPLFNKFTPMPDSAHKQKLDALLQRCGFSAAGLFVMDGSRRSAHANAYFTGFGKHRRIVLFDTLISQLSPTQLEAVLAHEIGHYQRKHLQKRLVLMAAMSLALLWALFQLLHAPWFYSGLGVDSANPATALALFSMAMPLCLLPLTPLSNALSRKHEYEADAYAAQHSSAQELIDALITMYRENAATLTPDSLYSLWHDSHPPATLRSAHLAAQPGAHA
ncbi:M48 family metallopeptidase [Fluviibacter phosphoraccumulans]|uniref:Peptidase M48 n=1 Tax=Fluviibacter phosphoraccumulans TaxID=1751046 RepID=A0A7R6RBL0_9RHOO|nr:M48 family metallopeptidase [Fluviibacter phosphoraccumulans]BBU69733.1 peptidase M48 [Fluviibacter phosphoraccumulans]BBU71084.1 peptidase M48 [Fluviibacter phosphoraccumulans]